MEKGSIFVWVCLGVIGILSIFAMAFAGYTYTQTQQGGSINVRSINLGARTITTSSSSGIVISSGTYDITFQYTRPGVAGVQTSTATVGTYNFKSITDTSGLYNTYILELSIMSYTYTISPTATYIGALLTNFSPVPLVIPGITYLCSPYVVRQNTGAVDVTLNTVAVGAVNGLSLAIFPALGPSITSGYTVSTLQPIKIVVGEIAI